FGYLCLLIRCLHAHSPYLLTGLDHACPRTPYPHPTHARRPPQETPHHPTRPRRQPRYHRQALRPTRLPLPHGRPQASRPLPHLQDRRQDPYYLRPPRPPPGCPLMDRQAPAPQTAPPRDPPADAGPGADPCPAPEAPPGATLNIGPIL